MTKTFTYYLTVPNTSLRLSLEETTDPAAWEPLDRCAGEPYGVYRSICVLVSDAKTGEQAASYVDAVLTDGDDEIGYQADPDRGDWVGDAAIVAAASAHSRAVYWTCFELLNRLGAALDPSARAAIAQQKKGA